MVVGVLVRKTVNVSEVDRLASSSELLGRALYCPLCRGELRGWGEGCTLVHLYCTECGLELIIANDQVLDASSLVELEEKLVKTLYEATE